MPSQVCKCYEDGDGFGVERKHMIDAIDAACKGMVHLAFGPEGTGNWRYGINTWPYWTDASYDGELEEGIISVILMWKGGVGDKAPYCQGSTVIPYDVCMSGMRSIIDGCTTESEDHKLGGIGEDACIEWTVDANTRLHLTDWDLTSRKQKWAGLPVVG